jgi:peptidoglycan endopeptidase LytE
LNEVGNSLMFLYENRQKVSYREIIKFCVKKTIFLKNPKQRFFISNNKIASKLRISLLFLSTLYLSFPLALMPTSKVDAAVKVSIDSSSNAQDQSSDPIIAAQLAAAIASDVGSVVSNNVSQYADTVAAESQSDTNSLIDNNSTPKLDSSSQSSSKSRSSTVIYTVLEGDDVNKVAGIFGLSPNTIRWVNNIDGDSLTVGSDITVLPVDGLIHRVQSGETAASLAEKYKSNAADIISFNNIQNDTLVEGSDIVIPGGTKPVTVIEKKAEEAKTKKTYTQTDVTVKNLGASGYAVSGNNTYAYGYCTWHAANRRAAIGRPIPNRMGNAISWASAARGAGYSVDGDPQSGDVLYHKYQGGAGHVAFVESINEDGSILVSDMNYNGGWGRVSYRTVSQSEFSKYLFIH